MSDETTEGRGTSVSVGMAVGDTARDAEPTLREVVEVLAAIGRGPGSEGERRAAQWICERLLAAGAREARVEEAAFLYGYAPLIGALSASATACGLVGGARPTRWPAALLAGLAAGLIADDISNGPRIARRAAYRPRTTTNVVAEAGDPAAERTLVVLAHHDAAPTGHIFDDRLQAALGERFAGLLERIDTSLPLWWLVLAGPALVAAGAAGRRNGARRLGALLSAGSAVAFADIARSPIVPGASDNLTAVAVLVALAERLSARPLAGLRVLLASCGAEEVIQGGIHAFAQRHFPALDREHTWFLNLETLGSPQLILLEGEGPVVMEDYHDRTFRDLVAGTAERAGVGLRRGMRARNSTDAVIPSRAGYPTATLCSMNRYKALAHYHQPSDVPSNVRFDTVRRALLVTEGVARRLAADPWAKD